MHSCSSRSVLKSTHDLLGSSIGDQIQAHCMEYTARGMTGAGLVARSGLARAVSGPAFSTLPSSRPTATPKTCLADHETRDAYYVHMSYRWPYGAPTARINLRFADRRSSRVIEQPTRCIVKTRPILEKQNTIPGA